MRAHNFKAVLVKTGFAASILLASATAFAQSVVNLTAAPSNAALPDGRTVPMWGYSCGAAVTGSTATCAASNPNAGANWSPVVITVPYAGASTSLTINLANNLPAPVPTSLVVVGQLGGGLGGAPTTTPSPAHTIQTVTWPASGDTSGATNTPPPQPPRVQSFATEVGTGATTALTWSSLRPGTYLIESGTHPSIQGPMGLYGVLVVTTPPVAGTPNVPGTAYPGVSYDADVPLLLSEIDPVQNAAVSAAVNAAGFSETSVIAMRDVVSAIALALDANGNPLNAGTGYAVNDTVNIIGGGGNNATAQVASVDGTGAITAITVTNGGTAYSSIPTSVTVTSATGTGAQLVAVLSRAGALCSDGAAACYPPAVNYDPRYYLINGVSFDRTQVANSLFAANSAYSATGNVLVRFVNAGLRMHVPSIVGAQTGTTAVSGLALIAEDGNVLPGIPKVQNEVFLAAGKTYDVLINAPAGGAPALPVFDRQLSLSTNNQRDGGMQGYIGVNGATAASANTVVSAANKTYYCRAATQLAVTDPSKGVLAGATGANGATLGTVALVNAADALSFNANGTFTYVPDPTATTCGGTFQFLVNGSIANTATITQCDASTAGNSACAGIVGGAPVANADSYSSNVASYLKIGTPGVLANDTDPAGLQLKVDPASVVNNNAGILTVGVNPDGSFTASATAPGTYSFAYNAKNSQGRSSNAAQVTLTFPAGSGLKVDLADAIDPTMKMTDYRWIIEEDKTWYSDPACQINTTGARVDAQGHACPPLPVESLAYSFHTANMPVIATGCTGYASCETGQMVQGAPATCDIGDGVCRATADNSGLGVTVDAAAGQKTPLDPGQVALDPNKRYFLSILPADSINPTLAGAGGPVTFTDAQGHTQTRQFTVTGGPNNFGDCTSFATPTATTPAGDCGHGMSGAPISAAQIAAGQVSVRAQRTPLPTAQVAAFVYEDDNPLNGENDAGGGVDVLAPQEPGLGGFELTIFDQAGALGDPTGQITYDMSNMPVANSLAGTIDPLTGQDACPITLRPDHIAGFIPVCPKYEADGTTLSPLAGQAIVKNLYAGMYEIVATPSADRIARGEEWLQTNTLDGSRPHEVAIKPSEPAYFQEFGPGSFHVSIGFANPKIINDRRSNAQGTGVCDPLPNGGGLTCPSSLTVNVAKTHMARTPDQRVYSSGSYDAYSFTTCYVAIGTPDGADFALEKCDANGQVKFSNIPNGDWKLAVFDQWNDLTLDGLVSAVHLHCTPVAPATSCDDTTVAANPTQEFPVTQWRTNIMTRTFLDTNGNGVSNDDGTEPGLTLVATNIRYRDGSFGFFNNTDLYGYAGFNEVFPFMNWLVVETDSTRFKTTGIHTVNDTGGPVDGTPGGGSSTIASGQANSIETNPLPAALRVPGAVYCDNADCTGFSIKNGPGSSATGSSGRIDPPMPWGPTMAWQGLLGQTDFVEFGMKPFVPGENGGIKGHVIYASTRPFDDPSLLLQLSWEPGVPRVQINLYQEGTAPDGTTSLKLVDTTTTTSWDDWAQGFRRDANGNLMQTADGGYIPNMSCPGQVPDSPFFATLQGSRQFLDPDRKPLSANSQFKCFDGWAMLNQIQPAPYDGMYKFPSVTAVDPATGKPAKTNCTACVTNPDDGNPMLPSGKYVVEVIVPPGFELVKEEDKNILMGDIYVAPVAQQFAGLGNVFIMPDQAAVNAYYNKNNPIMPTTNQGSTTFPRHEGDTGSVEAFWPCVGAMRVVPDFMSLYPAVGQNAPFAGALRPLCDRKEVTLQEQAAALAKFYIFTPTHIAGHFTGTITNDMASEFDPFSPQFGEKFGPPNLPVGMRDYNGYEVNRVYADQWGVYNGLFTSSWEVNPPNPTGYGPQMAVACMNDPGPIPDPAHPGQTMIDPAYSPAYSNFCYETPFMPGFTAYMDTPVVPVQAFADQYNLPDAEYPNNTPAVRSVVGGVGPWVSAPGNTLTITALGDKQVVNPMFAGPNANTAPYNQKTITRHYGFGSNTGTVTIGGVNAPVTGWSDTSITVTVPATVPNCALQQVGQPSVQQCGELVITAANGKKSIDAVTVTIGGNTPTYIAGENVAGNALQAAIDAAAPGDLIIVGPGSYKEHLIMWKPVRLQGVGANSTILNADAHPAGVLDPWRRQINCVFGLSLNGVPANSASLGLSPPVNNFDPSGQYSCPDAQYMHVDRIAYEAIVGWDASGNGNLAQVLQEPTLMGAYEGAGITVLGRGARIPDSGPLMYDFWGQSATGGAGSFTDGSTWLTAADCTPPGTTPALGRDYYTSNFYCNPSRIDGLAIINSSQGGGALFVHGWGHNLEVANTRMFANQGTLTGGINLGNGETPDAYLNDGTCTTPATTPCPPIPAGTVANQAIPFQFNQNVHIHNNAIYDNASIGDALFSGTPTGAGGITISSGSDNYQIDHNWIAGNLTTGDGGGVQHVGLSFNGKINNNWILFNQSTNPTLPTNGGGVAIMGANIDRVGQTIQGIACGGPSDADCPPGQGEGAGGGIVVDSNLILGNSAESGSGGGLRVQQVNGTEVGLFPTDASKWYDIKVTNNIIVNNVAGWDGAGVSVEDALKASFVNNTIASNDTTASAGVLFKTLGAANASSPPPGCDPAGITGPFCANGGNAGHGPQPAGLVVVRNTPNMVAALTGASVVCPTGYGYSGTNCAQFSLPQLVNNLIWKNRAFHVETTGMGTGTQNQQALVAMIPMLNQTSTGYCAPSGLAADGSTTPTPYWDVGVRGDLGVTDHTGGAQLTLANSILTNVNGYNTPVNLTLSRGIVAAASLLSTRATIDTNAPHGFSVGQSVTIAGVSDDAYNGTFTIVTCVPNLLVTCNSHEFQVLLGSAHSGAGIGGTASVTNTFLPNNLAADPLLVGQYCNGSRGAPENNGNMGSYNAPAGRSETTGLSTVFTFSNIAPAVTVDEGNNWINLVYGPLSMMTPASSNSGLTAAEQMLAVASVGVANGAYSIGLGSPAVDNGAATPGVPDHDFFGNPRPSGTGYDIGAVEFPVPQPVPAVSPAALAYGNVSINTTKTLALTVSNGAAATANLVLATPTVTGGNSSTKYSIAASSTCPIGGSGLAPGASCAINVTFAPTAILPQPQTATLNVNATNAAAIPVPLSGTGVIPRYTITPGPLAGHNFGNQSVGTSSGPFQFTLTNSAASLGNLQITGVPTLAGTFSDQFVAAYRAGDTCTLTTSLAPGASCRFSVVFAPTSTGAKGTGVLSPGARVDAAVEAGAVNTGLAGSPVWGTGIQAAASFSWTNGGTVGAWGNATGARTITVTNSGTAGSTLALSAVPVVANLTGGSQFSRTGGTCLNGTALAAGASCTVTVNRNRPTTGSTAGTGTLTVSDTGAASSPQVVNLSGT